MRVTAKSVIVLFSAFACLVGSPIRAGEGPRPAQKGAWVESGYAAFVDGAFEPGQITLSHDGALSTVGAARRGALYTAAPFCLGQGARPMAITWEAEVPAGGSVLAQVRRAGDREKLLEARWVGPDGGDGWFEKGGLISVSRAEPASASGASTGGSCWIQYRLKLVGGAQGGPKVGRVTVEYTFTGPRARRVDRELVLSSKDNRPVVTGFVSYVSNREPVVMHCCGREDYSDGYDDYAVQMSRDNGLTWTDPVVKWKSFKTPEGKVRYGEPAAYWDPHAEKLLVLIDKTLYPKDALTHQTKFQVVQYVYDPKTDRWSDERPLQLDSKSIAVSFAFPIRTSRGTIMVPACRAKLDAAGSILVDPRSHTPVYESITILGRRGGDGEIEWRLGRPVEVDAGVTTRGMDENTYAELRDGRVAMLIRASNAGAPELPGYKWLALSKDDGMSWTRPVPMPATGGAPIQSGANGSAFFRSIKNGRLYWIGNLCREGERPSGNMPRHTLMLVEVREDPPGFKRESIFHIDEMEPGDTKALQLSNFRFYQDRETGDLVLYMDRYGAKGEDWRKSDYFRYRVAIH
ncbi:MAG: exo-alpha-sialidase [Phycisphaerae bacterium]|nr:exo-alpha-sialidase [Phycisphaerae bacterium]